MARPSEYTQEIAEQICEQIATTDKGLDEICEESEELPSSRTFYRWISKQPELCQRYAYARELQAHYMADQIIYIADHPEQGVVTKDGPLGVTIETGDMLGHRKLKIDVRKWKAAKLAPKVYGDKLDVTSDNEKITAFTIGFKKADES